MKRHFGPRGWWPALRPGAGQSDRPVYDPRRRRLTAGQRFEISIGAILTQNTAWTNVEKAILNLHRRGALSFEKIRRIPRARLARLIRPSGYFNQKAIKLKNWIAFLGRRPSKAGQLDRMRHMDVDRARAALLSVNGIGPETADSILLYALEKPVFVVDAYTRRVFSRHGWISGNEPYETIRKQLEAALPPRVPLWNDYHAQIVEIGKTYCHRRRPLCRSCPLYGRDFFWSEAAFTSVIG